MCAAIFEGNIGTPVCGMPTSNPAGSPQFLWYCVIDCSADGLAQRVIAKLLGVSEPTASRLVTRGVAKLQGSLAAVAQSTGPPDAALWTRLEKALSGFLESSDAPPPPEMES